MMIFEHIKANLRFVSMIPIRSVLASKQQIYFGILHSRTKDFTDSTDPDASPGLALVKSRDIHHGFLMPNDT